MNTQTITLDIPQQARVGWTERSEVQQPLASMLEFASLTPTYTGYTGLENGGLPGGARVGWTERSEVQQPLASMLEFASLTPTYTGLTVLEIAISDQDFYDLDPLILTPAQTYAYRRHIKAPGQTRTYLFHRNLIYAPIVGDRLGKGEEQFKWESQMVERLLNSNAVIRRSV